jgi:hypothetical protein
MTIDGPKYEHRHIMEQILGRQLLTEEHVHHKNGDGLDNRAENLEVIEGAEHMRQHRLNGTRRPEWYDSLRKPPGQWSRNYKQCILCGSSKSPYSSKGRCAKCNQRRYNEQRRSNSKLSTGR